MKTTHRLWRYTQQYWRRLALSGITATLYGLFSAAPTYVIQHIVDTVFVQGLIHMLLPFIIIFVTLFALKGVFMYLSNYYMNWVGTRVVNDIRNDLFGKIIYFPISFYQETTTGSLLSYFINDINLIQNTSSSAIRNGMRSFFEALFLLGVAFIQNWHLALLLLTIGPLVGITIKRMGEYMRSTARASQNEMGNVSSFLQEIFVGIREIKSFSAEKTEVGRLRHFLDNYFGWTMRNVRVVSLTPALIEIIAMGGCSVILYVASKQVLSNVITPGQLASFFAATLLAYQPLKRLINVYADVQLGLAASDRVFELMDTAHPTLIEQAVELTTFEHTITFNDVSFSYKASTPVLENVTLSIHKGESVGILGPSGSGKSTLCDLILGFISPSSGTLAIDGHDIKTISRSSLRSKIGYVGQKTFLFNDTIHANIAYNNLSASNIAIQDASEKAYAHEFIRMLPSGYNTVVGENGTLLSGGQKQRITIARALLKNPEILIFDEATSALDAHSEEVIRQALTDIAKTKTVIVISHRKSLVATMDRVVTIRDKHVVELANKNRLLQSTQSTQP